jgi:hypothetical protein
MNVCTQHWFSQTCALSFFQTKKDHQQTGNHDDVSAQKHSAIPAQALAPEQQLSSSPRIRPCFVGFVVYGRCQQEGITIRFGTEPRDGDDNDEGHVGASSHPDRLDCHWDWRYHRIGVRNATTTSCMKACISPIHFCPVVASNSMHCFSPDDPPRRPFRFPYISLDFLSWSDSFRTVTPVRQRC